MTRLPKSSRLWAALLATLAATALAPPAGAQSAPARRDIPAKTTASHLRVPSTHSKNVQSVTVTSIDADTLHATLADGTTLDADIKPGSIFLQGGVSVAPADFPTGTKALMRTRTRASDGAMSVVMLSDQASADAIDAYRKKALVGHIVSVDDKTIVVKPDTGASATPLTLHFTAKTLFRHGGADATPGAFPVGAPVAVVTRGLPSGLLMASIVSDTAPDAAQEKATAKTISLSGRAADVQPDKGLLRIAPKTKPAQTIAVTDTTHIKVRKADATLKDITPGMRVTAHLSHQKDADGHTIAASLAAYDAAPPAIKKRATGKSAP